MQYEVVCNRIRDDIAGLLLELRPPTSGAAYAAACAAQSIAAALHHACGLPNDPRWTAALTSLQAFLEHCDSPKMGDSVALLELRGFIAENADLAGPHLEHALAS
jgi:hypothetical protein